jgi:hypothetical protein
MVVVVVGGAAVVVVGADVVVVVVATVVVGAVDVVGDASPLPPEQAESTSSNPVYKEMTRTGVGAL